MPIKVTEKWSTRVLSLKVPWTARREWVVTGTTSEGAALTAIDAADASIRVPQLNDQHPFSPFLKCSAPFVMGRHGLEGWAIGTDYAIPPNGNWNPNPSPAATTMVRWTNAKQSEPADMDVGDPNGVKSLPILNSNGQPPDSPFSRPTALKHLTILKTVPAWDPGWNVLWENAVNSHAVNLGNGIVIPAHQMYCSDIIPAGEFPLGSTALQMAFAFEVIFDNSLGKYPFQWRMMDSGDRGFAPGSPSGAIPRPFYSGTDQHSGRIRLNNTGLPYPGVDANNQLKVMDLKNALVAPVANPTVPQAWQSEELTDTKCWIRYYRRTRIADLRGLVQDLIAVVPQQ